MRIPVPLLYSIVNSGESPLLTGLKAFWAFESDGSDSSGNGNDLTAVNTPAHSTGVVGDAAYYTDNDSDYYYLPYTAGVTPEGTPFTLLWWYYAATGYDGNPTILYVGNAGQTEFLLRLLLDASGNVFMFTYSTGTTANGNTNRTSTLDAWHMLAITYDGSSSASISIDGGAFASVAGALNSTNDAQIRFGNGFNAIQATQRSDQGVLYDRVLSADEIAWLYNSGSGRSYADLVAYRG